MNRMKQKLKCNSGLTLLLAMILLLVAVTISAVVLTTAVSSVEATKSDREGEQAYLTVSSAVEMFKDGLDSCQAEVEYSIVTPIEYSLLRETDSELIKVFQSIETFRDNLLSKLKKYDVFGIIKAEEIFTESTFPKGMVYSTSMDELFNNSAKYSDLRSAVKSHFEDGTLFKVDVENQKTIQNDIWKAINYNLVGNLNTDALDELYSEQNAGEQQGIVVDEEALADVLQPENESATVVTDNFSVFLEDAITEAREEGLYIQDDVCIHMGNMGDVRVDFKMVKAEAPGEESMDAEEDADTEDAEEEDAEEEEDNIEQYNITAYFSLANPGDHDCRMKLTSTLEVTDYDSGEEETTEGSATPADLPQDARAYYCVDFATYTLDLSELLGNGGNSRLQTVIENIIKNALMSAIDLGDASMDVAELFFNEGNGVYRVYFPTNVRLIAVSTQQKVLGTRSDGSARLYNMRAVNTCIEKGDAVS